MPHHSCLETSVTSLSPDSNIFSIFVTYKRDFPKWRPDQHNCLFYTVHSLPTRTDWGVGGRGGGPLVQQVGRSPKLHSKEISRALRALEGWDPGCGQEACLIPWKPVCPTAHLLLSCGRSMWNNAEPYPMAPYLPSLSISHSLWPL